MKLFHRGYFVEQLRQIRTAGIVATAIFSAITISGFFVGLATNSANLPTGSSMALPMLMFLFIVGLILTFSAFGWMNHRKTSDFYHALPIKRSAMFGSTVTAIYFWIVIGLTAHTLILTVLNLVFHMPFNYLLLLAVWGNMLIVAIQMIGATSIACAISGSRFVNIFATLFVLFIPRLLLMVLAAFVSTNSIGLDLILKSSPLFDPSFNILGMPYMLAGGLLFASDFVSFTNAWASLYTLAYAAILLALGCLAFVRRKSEMAVIAIKNPIYQGAIRTAVGLPLLLVVIALWRNDPTHNEVPWAIYGILILLSFIFYCLYELISTRRIKKVLLAMPFYAICVGIALLYLIVPQFISKGINQQTATVSEIKGIRISAVQSLYDNTYDYNSQQTAKVLISDPEAIRVVSDAIDRQRTQLLHGKDDGPSVQTTVTEIGVDSASDYEQPEQDIWDETGIGQYTSLNVQIIKKDGSSLTRRLSFTYDEAEQLEQAMRKNEQWKALAAEYPKGTHYYSANQLTTREADEVGRLLEEEFKTLTPKERESIMSYRSGLQLELTGTYWAENYRNTFYLNESTPKASQRYLELLNQKTAVSFREGIRKVLKQLDEGIPSAPGFQIQFEEMYFTGYSMNYNVVGDGHFVYSKASDPYSYEILSILANASPATDMEECVIVRYDGLDNEDALTLTGYTLQEILFGFDDYRDKIVALRLTTADLAKIEALMARAEDIRDTKLV